MWLALALLASLDLAKVRLCPCAHDASLSGWALNACLWLLGCTYTLLFGRLPWEVLPMSHTSPLNRHRKHQINNDSQLSWRCHCVCSLPYRASFRCLSRLLTALPS